jgi:uncharacterized protein
MAGFNGLRGALAPVAAAMAALVVALLTPAVAAAWTPEAATYGVGENASQPVTMTDGTVLYCDDYYPTSNGAAAPGPFPAILTQTPYGKDDSSLTGSPDYFVERGYIYVICDVRGTGSSEGQFGFFDPVQGTDGATLVNYTAGLPHANGEVGLLGESYLGINQFETAADAGPAHVKAIFPIIAANDIYRDTALAGGFPDIEFDGIYLGLTSALNATLPAIQYDDSAATALADHVQDIATFDSSQLEDIETGGDEAYDQTYWGARNPNQYIPAIVKDGIPAFLVGGWYDLFQRGEMLNYSFFQNAFDGRDPEAPMAPDQPVTPRYQLLMGPWYHVTAGDGLDYHGLDLNGLELSWFDHWLKGIDTGVTDTTTPLHLEDLATGSYDEASRYPLDQATDTTYYLHSGGGLTTAKPTAATGSDELVFTGSEIPCTSSTEQWAAGAGPLALSFFGLKDPCTQGVNLSQVGPGTQSYTTAAFTKATTLAGPIGATIYATTTTKDAEWVVQVSNVAPNGNATALTSGLLEGNQRALDTANTWYAPDGNPILPYHPYTQAAQTAITPGTVTRFDVEVFPTFDTLQPGHKLRITIATSDFPHALATATQLPNLLGGVYQVERNAADASSVELPLAPAFTTTGNATFATAPKTTPLGCPAATGKLAGDAIGPARLGMTRAAVRQAFVASATSSTRGRATMVFYCLAHSGIRVGYLKDRAVLVLTANARYTLDGVKPGTKLALAAKQLDATHGYSVGRNTWYLIGSGAVVGVLKVQHGTVGEIGIANGRLVATRRAARAFLRSFD